MATIDRIRKFQQLENISNYALEKAVGVSNGYIAKCKNPTAEVLENILAFYPRLSAEWLMRGEGEMYRDVVGESLPAKLDQALNDDDLKRRLLEQMNIEELVRQEVEKQLKKEA